ncbi:MAG: hypothetical protein KGZ64_04855 [Thermaerobacter sp.]|nr:hypothetical protein [Thermaerobacter sp.]
MVRALERKLQTLKAALGDRESFKVKDAAEVLIIPKSTLYWDLFNMVEDGYLRRIGKGVFSFKEAHNSPLITGFTDKINSIMLETGVSYYFTGIDVLLKYMHHVPDAYPVMLYLENYTSSEVEDILLRKDIHVLSIKEAPSRSIVSNLSRLASVVLLYETKSFQFAANGFALPEKAFVDLFFEVTRRSYPLPLQELARVFVDMKRDGVIDPEKLLRIAHERSIRPDMQLLLQANRIHRGAISLANMVKEEQY